MAGVSDTGLEPIGAVQRTRTGREATEPMREDIRLLGAILGDTVREQNGDEVFDLVERARVESFRVRRSEIERADVARHFDGIDIHQAIPVIRAFSHFALLANVAEDIHRERRRAIHVAAGNPPQDSSLAATYLKLDAADLDASTVADALAGALVSPVITAHPTETRRRTVFDTQHRITQLMRLRAHGHTETDDGGDIELELRRQVLTLWQTALIRLSRLQISDEIAVGLRYYQTAFFEVMPKVNAEIREALRSRWPDADLLPEPILRPGSWIGGDRDGNPNVTADVVRLATGSAAYTALGHYAAELTTLEQELSMSARLVAVTDELAALAEHATSIPHRRALPPGSARDPGAPHRYRRRDSGSRAGEPARPRPPAIRHTGGAAGRSRHRRRLTAGNTAARCWPTTGWPDYGKPCTSSVFTCPAWTCGRTPTSMRRWSRSCLPGPECTPTTARWTKTNGSNILAAELNTRRPLIGDRDELSELARKELAIIGAATRAVAIYGSPAVPNYIISMCRSVSDLLEAAILLKECGSARRLRQRAALSGGHRAAVRDDRRPAPGRIDSGSGT